MRARKKFGQHFLDPAWVDRVVTAIDPRSDETFLEIGPGRGGLTFALSRRVGRLVAVEIDRDLAPALAARAPANVEVRQADFLTADLSDALSGAPPVRVAGNLPYNISTPILFRLLSLADEGRTVRDATVMVQREVAERLVASPGSGDWGVLTICQRLRADIDLLLHLPPGAFRPVPRVHSAVIRIRYRAARPAVRDLAAFETLARRLFMHRRKTLANALAPVATAGGLEPRSILARAGLDGGRRPETLDLAELAHLAEVFAAARRASVL